MKNNLKQDGNKINQTISVLFITSKMRKKLMMKNQKKKKNYHNIYMQH